MTLNDILILLDGIVFLYVIVMFIVFFAFVLFSTAKFTKHLKAKNSLHNFGLNNLQDSIPVSLLIPLYNEEVTICDTINSLLEVDYNEYEIIAINDGSTDTSIEKVIEKYNLKKIYKPMKKSIETSDIINIYSGVYKNISITLIDKENGGKADALNVGINYSKYPIYVAIDADSMLEAKAIKNIISPFMQNKRTVAVGGNIKISNNITIKNGKITKIDSPKKLIVSFQIIEYLRSFMTNRMTWDILNMNFIISGAFGAFNKNAVIEVGGYKTNTIGEDMELVMKLHRYYLEKKEEYNISYAPYAICYTQAPDKFKGLKTQRKRWQVGLIHCMAIHKRMFLDKKWFLAKMYFILFEMITPVIELFGMFIIILSFFMGIVNLEFLLFYCAIIILFGVVISTASILLESYAYKEFYNTKIRLKLIFLSIFEGIGYRQLLSLYRISAFIGYKKNKYKWGTISRSNNKS
ncbi:MAG: glycosyltransferase family 2 protein [Cellulosilyticaceae bacterium]